MRPALLRLLKRPSALSVLDSLISMPIGVDQLDLGRTTRCIGCLSESSRRPGNVPLAELRHTRGSGRSSPSTKRAFSFRVYNIRSPCQQATTGTEGSNLPKDSGLNLQSRSLALQPETLEYESDIGHEDEIGTRLVDSPAHRNDLALWAELLHYRQRHYGDNGTLEIWDGLTVRVDGVELPVDGEMADFFWQSFVDMGFKRDVLMNEVVNYAFKLWNKTGKRWDKLYEAIVGGYIERGMARPAVAWHKKLQHPHLACPNDILRVFRPDVAAQQRGRVAGSAKAGRIPRLRAFRGICRVTEGHQIYAPVMSTLVRGGYLENLRPMHIFLIEKHDHPLTFSDLKPLLECAEEFEPRFYQELYDYASQQFPTEIGETQESKSTVQDEVEEITPGGQQHMKDDFCARVFATDALDFETILSGLKMFGVPAIGPQSLREMALRAHGSQDILHKLQELDRAGISIGDSTFARLLRKLATENRDIVLSDLLHSDEHPDALEDSCVQESLLLSYYLSRDWRLYNMTLAILSELSKEGPDLLNIHFRKHLAAGEWDLASKIADTMILRSETPSRASIDSMVQIVLTPRKPGAGPVQGQGRSEIAEVTFMFRILQRIIPLGASVDPELWKEMIKRFGLMNRWDELRTCCLWLARHNSPTWKQANSALEIIASSATPRPADAGLLLRQGEALLQAIFSNRMQSAIVNWGFQMRVSSKWGDDSPAGVDGENLVPWVRGLVLLRELEQYGVQLSTSSISDACRYRLTVLFGQSRPSNRDKNRMLREENPYSADQVVRDINRAWGEPSLFGGQEYTDFYGLVNRRTSKMSVRRTGRTLWRRRSLKGAAFMNSG
ncbi:hypothetical protein BO71DRAFT_159898 [Aspergillus ellipticus CBS 707.79]|uniref:Uncharacterized protein n=1 Tax=Aspergillus ellipticus CBS 707.79 TaxID=1448320 RepID=A0A319DHE9_9EURO|nr:hypothetical protein BO71DRAFT_159898 [Aspergillus ellipticus CBS 707.79]